MSGALRHHHRQDCLCQRDLAQYIDLQQGAMNVMGGVGGGTAQALTDLINATSGDTTIGGVNVASMKNMMTGQAMSTVNVTALP